MSTLCVRFLPEKMKWCLLPLISVRHNAILAFNVVFMHEWKMESKSHGYVLYICE